MTRYSPDYPDYEGSGLVLVLTDQARMEMKQILQQNLPEKENPRFLCEHVENILIGAGAMAVVLSLFILVLAAYAIYR